MEGSLPTPGGVIYRDDFVQVALPFAGPQESQYIGWLVVELRRHVAELSDLTELEAEAVGRVAVMVARALRAVSSVEHVYSFVLGNAVPHFHQHLIGRHAGTPREYWGQRIDEWPDAPRGDGPALEEFANSIRSWLQENA